MSFKNPQLPEDIKLGPHRPFLDFLVQGGLAMVLLVGLVWGVFQLGSLIGPLIPFEWEKQAAGLAQQSTPLSEQTPEAEARRKVLQRLVDELTPSLDLPDGMDITIHYSSTKDVNAFATLGGNVLVFEGLIERLPSENALSMVIAHEIGHVKHRDVMRGMGGRMMLMLIVGLATGDSGLAAEVVTNIQVLTELQHSRHAEEWADLEGVTALQGNYGHVNGYKQTFDALTDWMKDIGADLAQPPEFLRTHPDIQTRLRKISAFVDKKGWSEEGELTPLRQANYPPPAPARSGWTAQSGGDWVPSPKRKLLDGYGEEGAPPAEIDRKTPDTLGDQTLNEGLGFNGECGC